MLQIIYFILYRWTEHAILHAAPGSKHTIDVLIKNSAGKEIKLLGQILVWYKRFLKWYFIESANLQHCSSSFVNIDVGKPDAHLLVSFGEDFPNHGHRGTGPAAIQLVRKMDPSGHVILASNTTLKTTVRIIIRIFLDSF